MEENKAVLFDLFGTLCEWLSPEKMIIDEWGLQKSSHDGLQRVVCGTKFDGDIDKYDNLVLKEAQIDATEDNKRNLAHILEMSFKAANIFPETKKVLEVLKQKYRIGLVSNAYPGVRERVIEANKLSENFDFMAFSYELGMTKQNPDIYKVTLEALKTSAENAIMVGDNFESDILSSKHATLGSIGGILISDNPYLSGLERFTAVPRLSHVPSAVEKYFSTGRF